MTLAPALRLLWLTEHYYPSGGGMARACDRIVRGLRTAGAMVDVVHLVRAERALTAAVRRQGREIVIGVGTDPAHALNCLWNWLAADEHRTALTHVVAFGGQLPLLAGPVYSAWLDRPLITLLRGNDFDTGLFTPGRESVLHEALRRSARVGVVSRDKAWKIRALYPAIEPVWTPNGIDVAAWEPLPSQRARALAWRQAAAPQQRVLGIIGQIKRKKGVLDFLEMLRQSGLAARFHVLLVGDVEEPLAAWLTDWASVISHTRVPFIDHEALLSYYPACDLVVLPSLYDGLPNVLLEAAALGVPLLASTAGGMADLLVDGEHGFLFHPGDAAACRAAITRAADATAADLARMGEQCRRLVQTALTAAQETERYLEMLRATVAVAPALQENGDADALG